MDDDTEIDGKKPKSSKLPLLLGLVLALIGAGAGYVFAPGQSVPKEEAKPVAAILDIGDVVFVSVDPLTINIETKEGPRYLKFQAQIETNSAYEADVSKVMPRIIDVFNSYLRAVTYEEMSKPAALITIRSQLLRRAQLVTGEKLINDLLIMEFVIA